MDPLIRERILALNPWFAEPSAFREEAVGRLPAPFVDRNLDLEDRTDAGNAVLVVGPRQAGKSTSVWRLIAERAPETVLVLDAEDGLVRRWCESGPAFVADLRASLPSVRTVFVDEAQRLEQAGLFVKGLVDARRGLEVFVTGSSSFHLAARTRESLAGRAERHVLLPFSLAEVSGHEPAPVPAAQHDRAVRDARTMLVWGGYPRVWLGDQRRRTLANLVEAFVLRDASDRFALERPDALRRLLQLAAGQVGQMVNFSEWAALCGVAGTTVRDYVSILEECWVLKLLPAFAGGKRREITSAPRVHFYDPGIRNAVLGALSEDVDRRPDRGALFETLVFAEIAKTVDRSWGVHYWRAKGGAEVDFVLIRGDRAVAVEVKAGARPNLSRSARSFIDAYEPSDFLLVTGVDDPGVEDERVGPTRVRRVGLVSLSRHLRDATAD